MVRLKADLEKERMSLEDFKGYKQMVLRLRWMTIIITSYLILFGRGIAFPQLFPSLLILFYLFSNVVAYFISASYFTKLSFFYIVLLFDTFMVSLGIYITSQFDTDFYLVYFLIILFASIARSFKLLMVNALVICGIYGWFLWTKGWDMNLLDEGILLRIPFIFIMNIFYGFLIQSFEERTKRIKMELREIGESEQRYRQIVESAHDAVAILDGKNRIKFFNKRLLYLTQYAPEELTGMELTKLINGLDMDEVNQGFAQGSKGGSVIHETEVLQKNGGKRKAEVSAANFFLSPNRTHTILYLKDITEKKQMEERLIQSEKLRALGEMAAGVAHDFNNILGAILGRVQLIKLGLRRMSDEVVQNELGIIEQAAMDGAHTIKKLQEFTRPKTDTSKFVPLDVNEIIDGATELVKTKIKDEAEAKGVQIEVHTIKKEVPSVLGNPVELREVLLNIILNSIDAMPEGGRITFKTGHEDSSVFIEASDEGIGMPEYIRQRIFDPFFTTKGVQRSGLGLSISYGIIHRHHGEIDVKSQEGMGTTFLIKLPIAHE
jgi:PAS domain S-box-containing protein